MKVFIFVLSLLLIRTAYADDRGFILHCVQKRPASRVVLIHEPESGTRLQWAVEGGIHNIPLTDSPVSAWQLPMLKYQIEDLKDFPQTGELRWDKGTCASTAPGLMTCGVGMPVTAFPYTNSLMSTWQKTATGANGEFKSWTIQLAVGTDSNTYFLPLTFYAELCQLRPR
ncbi:MAG: hypothetical protein AB7N80_10350 [Bdellovibrionales bacterium]